MIYFATVGFEPGPVDSGVLSGSFVQWGGNIGETFVCLIIRQLGCCFANPGSVGKISAILVGVHRVGRVHVSGAVCNHPG